MNNKRLVEKMENKLENFFKKKLIDNKGTKQVYSNHIKRYFKVNNKDMNTYFDSKQQYEEHITNYWNYLKDKSPNSRSMGISSIKNFLRAYDKTTRDLEIWDTIATRLRGKSSVIIKHVPDIDEIRQILHYADIRTKTAIMMSITSGMRIGEICKLERNDVYMDEQPTRINVRAEITKTKRRRTCFISPEATNLLKEWLRVRDEYLEQSLKSYNFKDNTRYYKKRDDSRIFPYKPLAIRNGFNKACERAGFKNKSKCNGDFDNKIHRSRRELSFHGLRAFFRTYLGNADLSEHLMGHTGYLSTYRDFTQKQLAEQYMKYVPNVTVFEREVDTHGLNNKVENLKARIKTLEAEKKALEKETEEHKYKELFNDLKQKITKQNDNILQLMNDKIKMEKKIATLNKQVKATI
jgi:integrase